MKKILKWVGISLGGLLLTLSIAAFYFKTSFENKATKSYKPEITEIPILSDSLSIERGRILSVECQGCHGFDYAGKDFFNDPMIGYMSSPNLTPAKGSAVEKYSNQDWVRSLRHGLNPKGNPLMVMPAESIGLLDDEDLGSLIAYLKTLEPIEKPMGETKFTLMASVMAGAGLFGNLYPYDVINHEAVQTITAPKLDSSITYGEYMVGYGGCRSCHGEQLNGGKSPDPISPNPTNISPGGNFGKWDLENFKNTMRSGTTPEGKVLDPAYMPWVGLSVLSDTELTALYYYLKAQPSLADSEGITK